MVDELHCCRVVVFNAGRIQQLATPDQLYEAPSNAAVAQFIGENNRLLGRVRSVEGQCCDVGRGRRRARAGGECRDAGLGHHALAAARTGGLGLRRRRPASTCSGTTTSSSRCPTRRPCRAAPRRRRDRRLARGRLPGARSAARLTVAGAVVHMMQRRIEVGLLDAAAAYFHHATPGLGPQIEVPPFFGRPCGRARPCLRGQKARSARRARDADRRRAGRRRQEPSRLRARQEGRRCADACGKSAISRALA
jgi:hypothetical protein